MSIKTIKRIILILLATVLTTFCLVTLVGAISFVKENPPQRDIAALESLDDSNLESVYKNNELFSIWSSEGLQNLDLFLNKGYNFKGKRGDRGWQTAVFLQNAY